MFRKIQVNFMHTRTTILLIGERIARLGSAGGTNTGCLGSDAGIASLVDDKDTNELGHKLQEHGRRECIKDGYRPEDPGQERIERLHHKEHGNDHHRLALPLLRETVTSDQLQRRPHPTTTSRPPRACLPWQP